MATKGSNTSNLLAHLRTKHPIIYANLRKPTAKKHRCAGPGPGTGGGGMSGAQPSLAETIASSTTYPRNST